jgi:hypothetical protein
MSNKFAGGIAVVTGDSTGMGLATDDEAEFRLPMSARYVIDQKGIIRVPDVDADYTIRTEPSDILNALRALKA